MWIQNNIKSIFWGFVLFFVLLIILFSIIRRILDEKAMRKIKSEKEKQFQQERAVFVRQYDKSPEELANMPGDVEIGRDSLPKEVDADGWGGKFTFYYSYRGRAYHRIPTCSSPYHLSRIHAWNALNSDLTPCAKCNPILPDLQWFSRYKKILSNMQKYDIIPLPYKGPSRDYFRALKAENETRSLNQKLSKATDELEHYKNLNIDAEIEKRAIEIVNMRVDAVLRKSLFQQSLLSHDFRSRLPIETNSRLLKAQREKEEIIPPLEVIAKIKGSADQPYTVTLNCCTCPDFERTQRPCKHMYRLALELGLLLSIPTMDIDNALFRLSLVYASNEKALKKLRKK